MNNEKLDEVAKLLDVESSEVVDSKIKRIMKEITFPIVQMAVFGLSSILGLTFGNWENKNPSIYPYGLIPRVYTLGAFLIVGINTGNIIYSSINRKKVGINPIRIFIIVMLNFALSFISFFLLYNFIEEIAQSINNPCYTVSYMYGVYDKEDK